MLEHTKRFLSSEPDITNPLRLLADVLAASIELISSDANDFAWSSWKDRNDANDELRALLETGAIRRRSKAVRSRRPLRTNRPAPGVEHG